MHSAEDPLNQILKCTSKEHNVAVALKFVQNFSPENIHKGLEEWNTEQGLILQSGMIYMPLDNSICQDIGQTNFLLYMYTPILR